MKLTDLLSKNHALIQWQREQNKITRTLFTGIQGHHQNTFDGDCFRSSTA